MVSSFEDERQGEAVKLQELTEAIFNGDGKARIQAAREIRGCATNSKNVIGAGFGVSAVIASLVSMLRSEDLDATEASLYAILDLAVRNQRNKIGIVEAGAIPSLVELLRLENRSLREPAITALGLLSACTVNKPPIASSGAIPLLVETLSSNSGNRQEKHEAVALLNNLSTCQQYIPAIIAAGVIPSLLYLLLRTKKSSKFAEKATALLECLSSTETGQSEISGVEGGILALVETIEEGSGQSKEHAVGTLLAMCESSREKYRGLILKEGVIPGLLQLTVRGSRRSQERARALLKLLRDSKPR